MSLSTYFNTAALLITSIAIVISLVALVMLLWQDARSSVNLVFSIFLGMVVAWAAGTLISRFGALANAPISLVTVGVRLIELGFTGACVGLYIFSITLTGEINRRFGRLAIPGIIVVVGYQLLLAITSQEPAFDVKADGTLSYVYAPLASLLYMAFILAAMLLIWQRRHRIEQFWLRIGLFGVAAGMLIELVIPEARSRALSIDLASIATLALSYAMLRIQIIDPLAGRAAQIQAVRDVGLAITSSLSLEAVLKTIAEQAARILEASGAAIFLYQGGNLELVAEHGMHPAFRGYRLGPGEGFVARVVATRKVMSIDDYHRQWKGQPDTPYARTAFGAVVAVPLIVKQEVMGVLFVTESVNGKRFDREDEQLLELLGPQAAVAIINSRSYERTQRIADELEQAKNQLETFLASTDNPVLAINRNLQIIFANPAAAALFGTLPSGRALQAAVPREALPRDLRKTLRTLIKDGTCTYELTVQAQTYLCHLSLIRRPRVSGFVAVLNDITQLKELDQLKTHMIQLTAHQLKNPLFGAMASVELLRDSTKALLDAEMQDDFDKVETQLQRMRRIIENILNLERVESGGLAYEEFAMETVVESVYRDFVPQAKQHGIDLVIDIPAELPTIMGNPQFLIQALANLVENALKYSASGGKVTIGAAIDEGCVVLRVADTGAGIPPEDRPRIFERFYRARQTTVDHRRGTGLGLSLVRAVVEAHNGRVWFDSTVQQGTTFYMALPTTA